MIRINRITGQTENVSETIVKKIDIRDVQKLLDDGSEMELLQDDLYIYVKKGEKTDTAEKLAELQK